MLIEYILRRGRVQIREIVGIGAGLAWIAKHKVVKWRDRRGR